MKQREPRRNVMISARMRAGERWSDANILNVSSRGLLLHSGSPPSRGTYIEVRRGSYVIVARVVWTDANRFGVRAQDKLSFDSLVAERPAVMQPANDAGASNERRASPRSDGLEWRHTQFRDRSRVLQFAWLLGIGFVLSTFVYKAVEDTLSQPMAILSDHLRVKG